MGVQLKLPEVARRLGVSEKTARRYVKSGALPSMFVGNAYRVSEEDVEKFLQESKVTTGGDSGKAQRRSSPEPSLFNGDDEERREDTDYIHSNTVLDRIEAAGIGAREVVGEWRNESARILDEGRPPARHRAMEMRSFHNELSAIYMANVDALLRGARRGFVSVGRGSGEPQSLADDPSLWPREIREFIYEAGSHIAVLPAVIESLEREWKARGFESASFAMQRHSIAEGGLPSEIAEEAEWQAAVEKARTVAGIN